MKNIQMNKSLVLALAAVVALSACGKNMHIPTPDSKPKVDANAKSADGSAAGTDAAKKADGSAAGSADGADKKAASDLNQTDVLKALSKYDAAGIPADQKASTRFLGSPNSVSEDGKISFNKEATLASRAVIVVPAQAAIKRITSFKLELTDITVLANYSDKDGESIENEQLLVGLDKNFSLKLADVLKDVSADSIEALGMVGKDKVLVHFKGNVEIDLISALKLADAKDDDQKVVGKVLDFISKHSDVYAEGYRKFYVSFGQNTNVAAGKLLLQVETLADAKAPDAPTKLNHGEEDALPADALPEAAKVKVDPIVKEEATQEENKPASDESKKTDGQASSSTPAASTQSAVTEQTQAQKDAEKAKQEQAESAKKIADLEAEIKKLEEAKKSTAEEKQSKEERVSKSADETSNKDKEASSKNSEAASATGGKAESKDSKSDSKATVEKTEEVSTKVEDSQKK